MPRTKIHLEGVKETLLLPLWARAEETMRSDAIVEDPQAVQMLREIDYDFKRFQGDWKSQTAIAVRTALIDTAVSDFLRRHPGAVVVNLGAGLDCRYCRLDNGRVTWYELDLPEVIATREQLLSPAERHRHVAKSVLDYTWLDEIDDRGGPVLLIAEGLLMYFQRHQVRALMRHLAARFPGAEMVLEALAYGAAGMSRYHDSLWRFHAEFKWALTDTRELERWCDRIKVLDDWCVLDHYRRRWGWLAALAAFPPVRLVYGERVLRLHFAAG